MVWVDESAFYLLPGVVRTYAPKGQTPILRLPLTRDHLSAISGITQGGRLFLRLQDRAYKSADVVEFRSGTGRRSTARSRSRTSWRAAPPGGCGWSSCPATPPS